MLDSADLKQALKVTSADLKQALKVTNRNERAADAVAALVGKSVALNAIQKLSDIPEKTEELVRRKQILADMYGFVEQSYASVLISGYLFQHGDENRQAFATAYRELYHALMDYINHSMRGMDMLYKADDCECPPWYIWNTSKEDFVDEWEAKYSMKFGDTMAAMRQQQGKMLGTITEYAAKVRDAFAAYSVDYRTDSPGRGVEVLQQYKEYCSRNPVQQHWG